MSEWYEWIVAGYALVAAGTFWFLMRVVQIRDSGDIVGIVAGAMFWPFFWIMAAVLLI
jgi:hypothetical protein